jgi:transposase
VRRIKQQRRETGQLAPRTPPPRQPKWKAWAEWLRAKVAARPDSYLRELQVQFQAERGEEVSLATISNALRALGFTQKKTLIASEQDRPDVAAQPQA